MQANIVKKMFLVSSNFNTCKEIKIQYNDIEEFSDLLRSKQGIYSLKNERIDCTIFLRIWLHKNNLLKS